MINTELKQYEQQLLEFIEGKISRFPLLTDNYLNHVINPEDEYFSYWDYDEYE